MAEAAFSALVALVGVLIGIAAGQGERDRHRFTERKQALYTDLWTAADRHKREVEAQVAWRQDLIDGKPDADPNRGPTIGLSEPVRLALKAVELLAPRDAVTAATELCTRTANLGAWFAWDGKGSPTGVPKVAWPEALGAWDKAAGDFLELARIDLRRGERSGWRRILPW